MGGPGVKEHALKEQAKKMVSDQGEREIATDLVEEDEEYTRNELAMETGIDDG